MTTHVGDSTIDTISETLYQQGDYLNPGEETFYSAVIRRKKIPAGLIKTRWIDSQIIALTDKHVIEIKFDGVPDYRVTRVPYSSILDIVLTARKTELIMSVKGGIGSISAKIGPDAPAVLEQIEKRRTPSP